MSPRRAFGTLFMAATEAIDKAWGWHRLPLPLALAVLEGIRMRMRRQNLYDPATAAWVWLQRYGVPYLCADGLTPLE
jgi:hypothetical protein